MSAPEVVPSTPRRPWPSGVVPVLPAGTVQGVGIEQHLAVAAATGHAGVSLRPRHVAEWCASGAGRTVAALAGQLADRGLLLAELDPVTGWSDPGSWPSARLPPEVLEVLDLAVALGARAVTALVAPGEGWEPAAGQEGLARLCAAAGERGVRVQVEPFGWSALWDLAEAVAAVASVGGPGDGVMLDSWHLQRRGGGPADVDAVPVARVVGVQLADGPARPSTADLAVDNRWGRRFPGRPGGEQHPEAVLASLLRRGWQGPVAVEVFGDASGDALGWGRRAADAFRAVLDATQEVGHGR